MSDVDLEGLQSIDLPVSLAPRDGKYYGTEIVDAHGNIVITLWTAEGEPSEREKACFGPDWNAKAWSEYCCDSHWECEQDLKHAQWIVHIINAAVLPDHALWHDMRVCNRPSFAVNDILEEDYSEPARGYGPSTK